MSTENKTAILALTPNAKKLGLELSSFIKDSQLYVSKKIKENDDGANLIEGRFMDFVGTAFKKYSNLIFIMATGIVVRSIAPHVNDKRYDPCVIVMDEKGRNVISLLSGHIGGGNELAGYIAKKIDANPVITTSTDVNGKGALDLFVKQVGASLGNFKECTKFFNMNLIQGKRLGMLFDMAGISDIKELGFDMDAVRGFEMSNDVKDTIALDGLVLVTNRENTEVQKSLSNIYKDLSASGKTADQLVQEDGKVKIMATALLKNIVIAVGCRRGKTVDEIRRALFQFLSDNGLNVKSILKIATVDLKADEEGIIALAKELEVPLEIVERSEIEKVDHLFERSEFVKKSIGVYSVVNPVTHIKSGGNIVAKRQSFGGITLAAGVVI